MSERGFLTPHAPKPPREVEQIEKDIQTVEDQLRSFDRQAAAGQSISDWQVERVEDRRFKLQTELREAKARGSQSAPAAVAQTTPDAAPANSEEQVPAAAPSASASRPFAVNALRATHVRVNFQGMNAPQAPRATAEAVSIPVTSEPEAATTEEAPAPDTRPDSEKTIEELRVEFQEDLKRKAAKRAEENPYEGPLGDVPEIVVPGVNPDRVRFENRAQEIEVVKTPAHTIIKEKEVTRWRGGNIEWARNTRAGKWLRNTVLAALAGTVATNIAVEAEHGGNPATARAESVAKALDPMSVEQMAQQVQDQVCSVMNVDFMHRFKYRDANGQDRWNPGAVVLPMAIEINKDCKAKVDVQVHIPYDFARTFSEIAATHPEKRQELIERLSKFITQKVQNRLEVRGIAGVTGTELVYDRAHNKVSNQIDLGKLDISDMQIAGEASAEAKASSEYAGVPSLEGRNPENEALAHKRLVDSVPLIRAAFERAGVSHDVLDHIHEVSYERDLFASQVHELAQVAQSVLGTSAESDEAMAYQLVQEINAGNPAVKKAVDANKSFHDTVQKYIIDHRGVNIRFNAETDTKETQVWNVSFPWPLLLLSLPFFAKGRLPQRYKDIVKSEKNVPAVMGTELTNMPQAVARRLFSETTPTTLEKERDFHEVYDSIDLNKDYKDTHLLLEHMLIEEVLPTLEGKDEPMIDYELVVNTAREYLTSDARRGEVTKGAYPTTSKAERRIAELLLSMWERHDAATYPMQGIDVNKALNYRHSPSVVYWAKTLGEYLTSISKETTTTDQFREKLFGKIQELRKQRDKEGGQDRNLFVQSETPVR